MTGIERAAVRRQAITVRSHVDKYLIHPLAVS
jgi:hypothetical protein